MGCVYKMKYYSDIKRSDILRFVSTQMNLKGIMLNELGLTEKGKYYMISLICRIFKTNQQT